MPAKDQTPAAQVEKAPEIIASSITPEPEGRKKAVIVAGGMTIPKADLSIVVETATLKAEVVDGEEVMVRRVKESHYPTGADIYLRYDEAVKFPADAARVVTVGKDVQQHRFKGFTRQVGYVNVGPASPAYAAANLAFQEGATEIEIVGLPDAEKERLQHYIDALPTDAVEPAAVKVSLT